jgi:PhnB protein
MDHMTEVSQPQTGPAPAGQPRVTVFFTVNDCAKAIEFYQQAFGAELLSRMDAPGGIVMHAEMRMGDSVFQLSDPAPSWGLVGPPAEGNCFSITFWTAEVDAVFERAVAGGATVLAPPDDVFSGDRQASVRCPFGVRWRIARHDRNVPDEEIEAAARAWVAQES